MAWTVLVKSILELLNKLSPFIFGWLLARSQARQKQEEKENEDLEYQLELELERPRDRNDLLDKLRKSGL